MFEWCRSSREDQPPAAPFDAALGHLTHQLVHAAMLYARPGKKPAD